MNTTCMLLSSVDIRYATSVDISYYEYIFYLSSADKKYPKFHCISDISVIPAFDAVVTHTYPCILYKFEVSCFELPLTDTDNISGVGLESLFLRTWTRTRMSMTRTRTLGTRLKTARVQLKSTVFLVVLYLPRSKFKASFWGGISR